MTKTPMKKRFNLRRNLYIDIALLILVFGLSSCAFFPYGRNAWNPLPITGSVIDCATSSFIPNAKIESDKHKPVITDQAGKFHLQGESRKVYVYGPQVNYVEVAITIIAKGYRSETTTAKHGERMHKAIDIGAVCLSRN